MKQKGFTLVELMIVVAVIGILSALAIPNYLKMVGRARQSEAKMNLGAIYSAQIAYYAEASTFSGGAQAFHQMGWEPTSTLVTRYAYIMDNDLIMPLYNPPASPPPGILVTKDSFTAQAAGNVDKDPELDVWTMDNLRDLKNVQPDLR
jgi:type IV pilus assembly protein PilA